MAGSTSGGISDLSLMMKLGVDQSSVTDSMKFVGDVQSKLAGLSDKLITLNLPQIQGEALSNSQGILKSREETLDAAREKESKAGELARMGEYYRGLELQQEEKLKSAKLDAINQFSNALASEESRATQRYKTEAERIDILYKKRRDNIAALQAMPGDPMDQSEVDKLNKRNAQQAKRESTNVVRGITDDVDARAASRLSAEEKIDEWEKKHISNIQSLTHLNNMQVAAAEAKVAKEAEAERVHLQEINLKSTLLKITNDIAAAEQRDMTFTEQQAVLAQQRLQAIDEAYGKFAQLTTLQEQQKQAAIDAVKNENMRAVTYHEEVEDAKKLKSLNDAMERSHVNVMKPMERITHEYEKQKKLINEITVAGSAENKALHAKNEIIKAGTIARETERGNLAGVGGFSKMGTRIQEIGRGFEDFTVGFSMAKTNIEGVAMGLRGSANNAAQLAASFNPVVGATVAIGASLATVIVPMVARWLWDTKALEEAQDKWNDKLKESGKEQIKVADALAKMRGTIREDADATPAEKGKKIVDGVKKAENDALAAKEKGASRQLTLNAAEQKAVESTAKKKKLEQERDYALIDATAAAAANLASGGLSPEAGAESKASTDALYIKQAEYDLAKKEAELADAAAKNAREDVSDAKKEMETAAEAEKAIRLKYGADIAWAETDVFNAEKDKQKQTLDAMNMSELQQDKDKARRKYELARERNYSLGLDESDTADLNAIAWKIRMKEEEAADKKAADKKETRLNKYEDMQQRIDADSGKATKSKEDDIMAEYNKRAKEIDRMEGDSDADKLAKKKLHASNLATFTSKMDQEQAAQNDKLAVKRIDAELQANADQQDALQERIQNAGNAAGPSAAMVSGTQAAESAINRALSGSQSVEGTMKSQLKVLQEIHKDLQKQKQAKTVSL